MSAEPKRPKRKSRKIQTEALPENRPENVSNGCDQLAEFRSKINAGAHSDDVRHCVVFIRELAQFHTAIPYILRRF